VRDVAATAHAPAIIDDDTPAPAHAQFRSARTIATLTIGLLLWLGVMAALVLPHGPSATLPTMGWFFTKAAFLTFGGAYAVLPYVNQGAVTQYQWLTPPQMIDGLALGETTPGPLIMVVVFVGYVGAWTHAAPSTSLPVAGLLGGLCAAYFTFLPSFLLILVGAPIVEGTRGNLKFSAPLTSITAAVVGVIVNLATFFAYHVLWPLGFAGSLDWRSLAIGAAAAVALFRFKLGIVLIVLASAVVGIAMSFWRPVMP
jgi:chromate transporter